MPWTCSYGPSLLDVGGYYPSIPALAGLAVLPPFLGLPATASGGSITFASLPATPPGGLDLLLTDPTSPTAGGGDFFRWNMGLPASTATLSSFTVPTASLRFAKNDLQATINGLLPITLASNDDPRFLTDVRITSADVGLPGAVLSIGVVGSARVVASGTILASISFRLDTDLAVLPSHDAGNLNRILSVKKTGSPRFIVFGFSPDFIPNMAADGLADTLVQTFENSLNDSIWEQAGSAAASQNQVLTAGSIISAQRVVLTKSGLGLGLVIANIFGPVFSPMLPKISASATISPDPMGRSGKPTQYKVRVTDAAGTPIQRAEVLLMNYSATRNPAPQHGPTDSSGVWMSDAHTALRDLVVPHTGIDTPPTVTVTPGNSGFQFTPVTLTLLLTP
jgi:hypothetical protein